MSRSERQAIAAELNRLPFVRWDRFTEDDESVLVYGWIDRLNDLRSDFVLLSFGRTNGEFDGRVGYTTSSAIWTNEIAMLLGYDPADPAHALCQRVEGEFAGLVENLIELPKAKVGAGPPPEPDHPAEPTYR